MKFLDFLFTTVDKFVIPADDNEHEKMMLQAKNEWAEMIIGAPVPDNQKTVRFKIMRWIKENTQNWLVQYGLSVAHLILVKMIQDWMQSTPERNEETDEELLQQFKMMRAMSNKQI